MWLRLLLVVCGCLMLTPTQAATFRWESGDQVDFIFLKGEIKRHDAQKLEKFYLEQRGSHPVAVMFDSLGGNLYEGLEIGRIIRKHDIRTFIGAKRKCYSACFFAFIGGSFRVVASGGKLGVHQFYGGKGDADFVEAATQLQTSELLEFVGQMGVDIETLKLAFKTLPDEMYVFNERELERFNLVYTDVKSDIEKMPGYIWQDDHGWSVNIVTDSINGKKRCLAAKLMKKGSYMAMVIAKGEVEFNVMVHRDVAISKGTLLLNQELVLLFDNNQIIKTKVGIMEVNNQMGVMAKLTNEIVEAIKASKTIAVYRKGEKLDEQDLIGSVEAISYLVTCGDILGINIEGK